MPEQDGAAARRAELENRNAALRNQIDGMLSDLRQQTAEIGRKQAEAAQRTYEVTSEDGLVTVRVDATGTVQQVALSSKAFARSTPERLSQTITGVVREASGTAQRALQDELAPSGPLPELSDIVPGAPSFQDLLPSRGTLLTPPDPDAERAAQPRSPGRPAPPEEPRPASAPPPAAPPRAPARPAASEPDDDEPRDTFLLREDR
ncbi:YbaB/EbfC family nucleoid-associated protein [Saccharopolyspora sp. CA-218241]|uniref:YbaB/EbfC family nucleoid-associated protein n=1 Tax=Saccharopolyspora sp. CA-218241 TaxID=3240027 RepID=UPI003D95E6EC